MPIVPLEEQSKFRNPIGLGSALEFYTPPPKEAESPSLWDLTTAGFRRESTFYGLYENFTAPAPDLSVDVNWNPFEGDYLANIPEDYRFAFAYTMNRQVSDRLKSKIRKEMEDTKTIQAGGLLGIGASMLGSVLSPEIGFPVGSLAKVAKAGQVIRPFLRGAGQVGAAGVAATTLSELGLQGVQETRSLEESLYNVVGAGVFTGALGGAVGLWGAKRAAELARAAEIEARIDTLGVKTAMAEAFENPKEWIGLSGPAQARRLADKLRNVDPELAELVLPGGIWKKSLRYGFRWNPVGALSTSQSPSARLFASVASDTPFLRRKPHIQMNIESATEAHYMREADKEFQIHKIWRDYKKTGDRTIPSFKAFREEITEANFIGDVADATRISSEEAQKFLAKGARVTRDFYDTAFREGKEVGIYSSAGENSVDPTHASRVWRNKRIELDKQGYKDEVLYPHFREQGFAGKELDDVADEVIDHILGSPTGVAPSMIITLPGSARRRLIRIKSTLARDWIERDAFVLMRRLTNRTGPDTEIARAFNAATSKAIRNAWDDAVAVTAQAVESGDVRPLDLLNARLHDLGKVGELSFSLKKGDFRLAEKLEKLIGEREEVARKIYPLEDLGKKADKATKDKLSAVRKELKAVEKEIRKIHKQRPKALDLSTEAGRLRETEALKLNAEELRQEQAQRAIRLDHVAGAITRDYDNLKAVAKSDRARRRLGRRQKREIEDFKLIRERLRNTAGMSSDPAHWAFRVERQLLNLNFMSKLGTVLISSLVDMAMGTFVHGVSPYLRSLRTLFRSPNMKKTVLELMDSEELARIIPALEMANNHQGRIMRMGDLVDTEVPGSIAERTGDLATHVFGHLTGITFWNSAMKGTMSLVAADRILRDAMDLVGGRATKLVRGNLQMAGISDDAAHAIVDQFAKHGQREVKGFKLNLPRSQRWDADIKRIFQTAVISDVRRTILTPSAGDKPRFMSKPFLRLMGQFRSFMFAATNRLTISGSQRLFGLGDANVAAGFVHAIALGVMVDHLKDVIAGRDPWEKDWKQRIVAGIERSGTPGPIFDASGIMEKWSGGRFGINPAVGAGVSRRYMSRDRFGAIAGPSVGMVSRLGEAVTDLLKEGQLTESDIHNMRRTTPTQNWIGTYRLFNWLEDAITKEFNLPKKE